MIGCYSHSSHHEQVAQANSFVCLYLLCVHAGLLGAEEGKVGEGAEDQPREAGQQMAADDEAEGCSTGMCIHKSAQEIVSTRFQASYRFSKGS